MSYFRINGRKYTTEDELDLEIAEAEIRELGNVPEDADVWQINPVQGEPDTKVERGAWVWLAGLGGLDASFESRPAG